MYVCMHVMHACMYVCTVMIRISALGGRAGGRALIKILDDEVNRRKEKFSTLELKHRKRDYIECFLYNNKEKMPYKREKMFVFFLFF